MQTLTICGSLEFLEQMKRLNTELEKKGVTVYIPEEQETANVQSTQDLKKRAIDRHLEKIRMSDAILVANHDKNGVSGYIGGNVFLEMGFAYALNKDIFVLHDIPDQVNTEEIKAVNPTILQGDLSIIYSS